MVSRINDLREISVPFSRMIARSTTFLSSRTFPGQE